ncbi:hypothetical protein DRW41_17040 [Neobacillus piezotolerans]|uniref:SelT/SelW/SelH family protein n=1 Tax=Neobacillus piezotolerans TaxID=2259171 RepID=A0A3D8GN03_9BACI|nr:hypothetical protein DRW41_17040 [Neobacillus piezotolerans]
MTHFRRDIARFELIPASGGIFEVYANGDKIYSKDETGVFPKAADIITKLESL